MSSALEGWYVDPSTGTNLRFWNGSTWTDEVAPMPYEPAHSGEVDLFATTAPADDVPEPDTETPAAEELPQPDLDPEIERTQLTRRELRARRETGADVDDAPKHLPPMTPPAAVSVAEWHEPVEELEVFAVPAVVQSEQIVQSEPVVESAPEVPEDPQQRRRRVIRMSVLLGILAVVSSVAVLTAGTL